MNLLEMTTLSEDECLTQLEKQVHANGYTLKTSSTEDFFYLELSGPKIWTTKHVDPKVAYLSALGWLEIQKTRVGSPLWKPREKEADLQYPSPISSKINVGDLDPNEISSVYNKHRK